MDINKYKEIPFKKRENCIVCGSGLKKAVIELPDFPLTEIYVEEKVSQKLGFMDQTFHLCKKCGQGQIANVIDKSFLYDDNYCTRTSTSASAVAAIDVFLGFVERIIEDKKVTNILEIGCNDLYTLRRLRDKADRLYGIDPILVEKGNCLDDEKIEFIADYVENIDLGKFDLNNSVVISSHTLEHLEDPVKLIQLLMDNASDETLFFFQFPGLESLIYNARFDQLFHQHLNYFSLKSVMYMLESVGAELIDFSVNVYHWGGLMIAFRKKKDKSCSKLKTSFKKYVVEWTDKEVLAQYELFKGCMKTANTRIYSLCKERIYGYGAALMLPVLGYYIEGLTKVEYILDDDIKKDGLFYLNVPIQIINSDKIKDLKDSVVLLTAINSKHAMRAIMARLVELRVRQIIIPNNLI